MNYEQHRFGMDSLCKDIFTYVKQDRDFNTGFYLRPQSESEALRNCSIYLASQVSENCQGSLSKVLQMLLVGCGSVSIFNQFVSGLVQAENDKEKFEQLLNEFIAYMSVGRNESVSHWASRCCAVVGDNKKTGISIGMVQLNRKRRDNKEKFQNYNVFDLERESGLAKAAMAASLSTVSSSNLMDFTSIFNLIGAVADLAECGADETSAKRVFNKIISQPTCALPSWNSAAAQADMRNTSLELDTQLDAQDDEESSPIDPDSSGDFDNAFSYIYIWLDSVSKLENQIRPSSILIGKIWTRFYFNLSNIENKHSSRLYNDAQLGLLASQSNAAKIMRYNLIAFLHSVLVEEDLYHISTNSSQLGDGLRDNPITSIDAFERKLRVIKNNLAKVNGSWEETYPLFYLLVSCPLLHPFIFPIGGVSTSTKAYEKENNINKMLSSIIGNSDTMLSNKEWAEVFKRKDDDVENKKHTNKIISSLNISYIANAPYEKATPAKTNKIPSSDTELV